tara:strand:- start:15 stop:185 length:171 start_codon:yes stop_codon:yes gene_type:complete
MPVKITKANNTNFNQKLPFMVVSLVAQRLCLNIQIGPIANLAQPIPFSLVLKTNTR